MSMMTKMMCGSLSAQCELPGENGERRRSVHSDVRGEEATTVLEAALVQVPAHGWSVRAIREGAVSLAPKVRACSEELKAQEVL